MLRFKLLAFVGGTASVHMLPVIPHWAWSASALTACCLLMAGLLRCRSAHKKWPRKLADLLACFALGAFLAMLRIDLRLQDSLSLDNENQALALRFLVTGLATSDDRGQRFEARVLDRTTGIPEVVMLSWYASPRSVAEIIPGQVWRGRVVLKRPHGSLNPHGFDYEAYLFERGIRATGSLRGKPELLSDRPYAGFGVAVQRIRHHARAVLRPVLRDKRYGPVLIALAMGDQASVDKGDWAIFNRTGITHLVSISGLHVTMLAALAGLSLLGIWKRSSWRGSHLPERQPAQIAGAAAALVVAWLYCLLAGWGVPAQRTFFMLAIVGGAALLRLPMSGSRVLVLAAVGVTTLDPWAPLAPGFWLSFGAVGVLVLCGSGRWRNDGRQVSEGWRAWLGRRLDTLREGGRAQAALTIGLLPLLAVLFQQISLVSPLANAFAIPLVSLIVTPLALGALLCCAIPGLQPIGGLLAGLAHSVFALMMKALVFLAEAPFSSYALAAVPWPLLLMALVGAIWAMQPRGVPGRHMALLLLLPMLVFRPARPAEGAWRLTALDVGQGAAILLETAEGALLYDTGPKFSSDTDAGARVVWPYLRARGIRNLNDVIVSHADLDHAGGLVSILAEVPASRVRASYDLPDNLSRHAVVPTFAFSRCQAGQQWKLGGVHLEFLHPQAGQIAMKPKDRNAASCVLRVSGSHHSALLTGDIGSDQEKLLAKTEALAADVVMAAHHGSRFSSGKEFARAVGASHVIAQAGYLNRYRHPHPEVIRRWERTGSVFHRTDRHGALTVVSDKSGLRVERAREVHRRYWHTP